MESPTVLVERWSVKYVGNTPREFIMAFCHAKAAKWVSPCTNSVVTKVKKYTMTSITVPARVIIYYLFCRFQNDKYIQFTWIIRNKYSPHFQAFYRRGVERKLVFFCPLYNDCLVKPGAKGCCKACRFRKCKELEMDIYGLYWLH